MKPGQFTYHAPATVDEAVKMLNAYAMLDGRVIAGGQSLVPAMALRLAPSTTFWPRLLCAPPTL